MMVERHPVVAALLEDGLERAKADAEIGGWVGERMTLLHASSMMRWTNLLTMKAWSVRMWSISTLCIHTRKNRRW